jgi:hypothetical protein
LPPWNSCQRADDVGLKVKRWTAVLSFDVSSELFELGLDVFTANAHRFESKASYPLNYVANAKRATRLDVLQ